MPKASLTQHQGQCPGADMRHTDDHAKRITDVLYAAAGRTTVNVPALELFAFVFALGR